jgi:hypothetical protein
VVYPSASSTGRARKQPLSFNVAKKRGFFDPVREILCSIPIALEPKARCAPAAISWQSVRAVSRRNVPSVRQEKPIKFLRDFLFSRLYFFPFAVFPISFCDFPQGKGALKPFC